MFWRRGSKASVVVSVAEKEFKSDKEKEDFRFLMVSSLTALLIKSSSKICQIMLFICVSCCEH
jgi:hypothetical protein